ncbi:MAG: hypothetical protein A2020_02145 [Lentisphaerae bacterium GWF2_45_14]|nr:MAG: hypothetical protein A2020_02145 [Lentisphaerae bacterium GWF2_45_14]
MVSMKIIIVDDEEIIRNGLSSFLEDEGFEILLAESAEEALLMFEKNKDIKAAVVDIRLPGKSGSELILEIARTMPGVKFVIYTGSTEFSLTPELEAVGICRNQVFYKPTPAIKIINAIKKNLGV